jgi:protoporphyrinogen IX oxidase
LMAALHGFLAKWRKDFAADRIPHSPRFFRVINEVPTVLLIGIVILAVVKPF